MFVCADLSEVFAPAHNNMPVAAATVNVADKGDNPPINGIYTIVSPSKLVAWKLTLTRKLFKHFHSDCGVKLIGFLLTFFVYENEKYLLLLSSHIIM